jgi:hypothetical protein
VRKQFQQLLHAHLRLGYIPYHTSIFCMRVTSRRVGLFFIVCSLVLFLFLVFLHHLLLSWLLIPHLTSLFLLINCKLPWGVVFTLGKPRSRN